MWSFLWNYWWTLVLGYLFLGAAIFYFLELTPETRPVFWGLVTKKQSLRQKLVALRPVAVDAASRQV